VLGRMWSWVGGRDGPERTAKAERLPVFELLEPRVLLDADFGGVPPLLSPEVSLHEQAVVVDLHEQDKQPEASESPILTCELAASADVVPAPRDQTESPAAVLSPVQAEPDEESVADWTGPVADSCAVRIDAPTASAVAPAFWASSGYNAQVNLSTSAAALPEETAGLNVPSQQADSISCSQVLPVGFRCRRYLSVSGRVAPPEHGTCPPVPARAAIPGWTAGSSRTLRPSRRRPPVRSWHGDTGTPRRTIPGPVDGAGT